MAEPRISVQISEEQNEKLSKIFPRGTKSRFVRIIVNFIIELVEELGEDFIWSLLACKKDISGKICNSLKANREKEESK